MVPITANAADPGEQGKENYRKVVCSAARGPAPPAGRRPPSPPLRGEPITAVRIAERVSTGSLLLEDFLIKFFYLIYQRLTQVQI